MSDGAATADPQIIFTPSGRRGRAPAGTTVLDAARSLGVDIDSVCGGRGICGRCAVVPAFGSFPKHGITSSPEHLSVAGEVEAAYRDEHGLAADRRLSCTATLLGDAVVDVPPESQVHKQVVRKDLAARAFEMDPVVRLHTVDVTEPDLATPTGDLGRLFDALRAEWNLDGLAADLSVIRGLQAALTAGSYRVTVAVHGGRDVIAVWPGFHDRAFGVAIDVGSTTIAGHLVNLTDGSVLASAGVMNPQIRFGEDLMSRVSYVMMHPGGEVELTEAVRKALDGLLATLGNKAGIKRAEILELAIVGNPIMHHLLLGIDPTPLGSAPFALATDAAVELTAAELGVRAHPGARVYVLPCIAGHVGADTAGVILAEEPHKADAMTLVVDVGTNAEIVLGDKRRLLAASSPTGPAFEGAQISSGQRAAPGAIERVRIDRETLEPRFRVIGVDAWSNDEGFTDAVAAAGTGVTGICGSGIIEVVAELYLAGIITADGVIDGARRGAHGARRVGRPDVQLRPACARRRWPTDPGDPERRSRDPARQGRALCRGPAAHGSPRDRDRRRGPAGRRVREPDRPAPRDGPGARPRLRSRPREGRRQRGRHRRVDRPVVRRRAARDRGRRSPRREDRNGGRAAVPGALRGGDGDPAPDGREPQSRAGRHPARPAHHRGSRWRCPGRTPPPTYRRGRRRRRRTRDPCCDRNRRRPMSETMGNRRTGGREGRRAVRLSHQVERLPFLTRTLAPFEVLGEEGLSIIEHNADTILEEVGIEFRGDEDALRLLRDAGADVDGERVRFPRGMCRQIVQASAPRQFTQYARNEANNVEIGGMHTVFAPNYGSPFVRDLDRGRRYGTIEDFRNFVKLAYMSPHLHHSGGTVCEPVDVPVNKRHLDMVYSHIRYSDKPFMGSVTAPERARDTVEMARLTFGADYLEDHCVILSLINANSPLVWDSTMLGAARAYAEANQATLMTPFILAGAMAPVTAAGVAAQTLAELLAGMTFVQLVRPGAPVVLGSFASSMSMQSGAPTFGTPEPALVLYVMASLARRLGVPFRSGGSLCASKIADAQAAYESAATLQPTVLGGVNFVLHAAGWLEGGLAVGYEKFIMDADQLGMMAVFVKGVDLSENGQALDAIRSNGPGQHFLGTAHTLANFENAFYRSEIADNNSFEQWSEDGGLDAPQRANAIWKRMLAEYEAPPIDPGVDEALLEFMIRRKASMPDSEV